MSYRPTPTPALTLDRTALVVLAAGAATRMGSPKALVTFEGRTLLEHLLSPHLLDRLADAVVVLGHHCDRVRPVAEQVGCRWVLNPDPDRGRMTSIQVGLAAIPPHTDAVFLQGVDCPLVRLATYERLAAQLGDADVSIPRYRGRDGHPPLISTRLLPAIVGARPDDSLRNILYSDDVRRTAVDVDDPGVLLNIDRPEDLSQLARLRPHR